MGGGELGDCGAESEVGRYLENHEGACDYEGLQSHAGVGAFGVSAKDSFLRWKKGGGPRDSKQFRNKMHGVE